MLLYIFIEKLQVIILWYIFFKAWIYAQIILYMERFCWNLKI